MNQNLFWGLSSCLLGLLCLGCANTNQVIRGQSPATVGVYHGDRGVFTKADALLRRPHYVQISQHPDGPERVEYLTKEGVPVDLRGNYYPAAQQGDCPDNGQGDCQHGSCYSHFPCGNYQYPTHVHSFSYYPPKDLVYPQPNTPAAVIQYPYYTVKGPDDFFLN